MKASDGGAYGDDRPLVNTRFMKSQEMRRSKENYPSA